MRKVQLITKQSGFSIIEVLLAGTIIGFLVVTLVGALIYGIESTQVGGSRSRGIFLADEGFEASRNIRDNNFNNLTVGNHGIGTTGPQWFFSGTSDLTDIFTRQLNVVWSGLGTGVKIATSTMSWAETAQRNISSILTTYLTDWRGCRGGVLVYGNGGTTTDAIAYKILDPVTCTWGSPLSAADIDTGTTNKALRAVQIYPSKTRDEKIMISRHFDGTNQYIYAQVYSGITGSSSWGNVQLLSSWTANTFLNVRNFDGTYLNDGTFMVIYSDNTTIPKMRIWNGTSWSAQSSLTSLGNNEIPTYVRSPARPGTNEVMAAFLTQAQDTISEYWSGSVWSAITVHATATFSASRQGMDFAWNLNTPTTGMITYKTSGGDLVPRGKVFVANGSGGGVWSAETTGSNWGASSSVLIVVDRPTANEFQICDKDAQAAPNIECKKATFSGSTLTWSNPTNNVLTTNSTNGNQTTFGVGFEEVSGDPAINVYSDNTSTPKLKKYTASTATWDAAATSLNTLGGVLQTVTIETYPFTDEMMVLMADANLDLFSIVWDGDSNAVYTTPSAYAFTTHGINGSNVLDIWYDFAWDLF